MKRVVLLIAYICQAYAMEEHEEFTPLPPLVAVSTAPEPLHMHNTAVVSLPSPATLSVEGFVVLMPQPPLQSSHLPEELPQQRHDIDLAVRYVQRRKCLHFTQGSFATAIIPGITCALAQKVLFPPLSLACLAYGACQCCSYECLPGPSRPISYSRSSRSKQLAPLGRYLNLNYFLNQMDRDIQKIPTSQEPRAPLARTLTQLHQHYTWLPHYLRRAYAHILEQERQAHAASSCTTNYNKSGYKCLTHPYNFLCSFFCCFEQPLTEPMLEEIEQKAAEVVAKINAYLSHYPPHIFPRTSVASIPTLRPQLRDPE